MKYMVYRLTNKYRRGKLSSGADHQNIRPAVQKIMKKLKEAETILRWAARRPISMCVPLGGSAAQILYAHR
jgi:hypothetical protein